MIPFFLINQIETRDCYLHVSERREVGLKRVFTVPFVESIDTCDRSKVSNIN